MFEYTRFHTFTGNLKIQIILEQIAIYKMIF